MIPKTVQQVAAFFRRGRKYVYNPFKKEESNYSDEELLRRSKKLEETYAQLAKIACDLGKFTINSLDLAICFAPEAGYTWVPIARLRTEMSIESPITGHAKQITVGFLGLNKTNLLNRFGVVATFYPFQEIVADFEKKEFPNDYVSLDYNGDTVIDVKEENFDKECEVLLTEATRVLTTVINIYEAGKKDMKKDQIIAASKNFEV